MRKFRADARPVKFSHCRFRSSAAVTGATRSSSGRSHSLKMETNMIIGSFDFDSKSNTYTGYIQTLLLDFAGVQFRPNTKASDKEPAYRIVIDRPQGVDLECGAAWSRTSEKGKA